MLICSKSKEKSIFKRRKCSRNLKILKILNKNKMLSADTDIMVITNA